MVLARFSLAGHDSVEDELGDLGASLVQLRCV